MDLLPSARAGTLRAMNTPQFRTLAFSTLILWTLGYALWVTFFYLRPTPFALDHALRGIPVYAFDAMLSLAIGRMLAWLNRHVSTRLLIATGTLAILAAAFLHALFFEIVMRTIAPHWGRPSWIGVLQQMTDFFWLFGGWLLLYFALASDASRRDREVQLAQAKAAATDAQHQLLVQQINPHFLFNALNTVYALVLEGDAARAQRCLLALSAFMRDSIDRNAPRKVLLSRELETIRHFLEIELIRFGDRLRLDESILSGPLNCWVPALILQPLVENCIKHGLRGHPGTMTIWLSASLEQNELVLSVENDGRSSPEQGVPISGVGLNNVRERLRLLYGDSARLIAQARPSGGFITRIHLPAS